MKLSDSSEGGPVQLSTEFIDYGVVALNDVPVYRPLRLKNHDANQTFTVFFSSSSALLHIQERNENYEMQASDPSALLKSYNALFDTVGEVSSLTLQPKQEVEVITWFAAERAQFPDVQPTDAALKIASSIQVSWCVEGTRASEEPLSICSINAVAMVFFSYLEVSTTLLQCSLAAHKAQLLRFTVENVSSEPLSFMVRKLSPPIRGLHIGVYDANNFDDPKLGHRIRLDSKGSVVLCLLIQADSAVPAGSYQELLQCVNTRNAENAMRIRVAIHMSSESDTGDIASTSPTKLDFGDVYRGTTASRPMEFTNLDPREDAVIRLLKEAPGQSHLEGKQNDWGGKVAIFRDGKEVEEVLVTGQRTKQSITVEYTPSVDTELLSIHFHLYFAVTTCSSSRYQLLCVSCHAKLFTSSIKVSHKEVHFGDCLVGQSKKVTFSIENLAPLPGKFRVEVRSKIITIEGRHSAHPNIRRKEIKEVFSIGPMSKLPITLRITPQRVNPTYRKEITVFNTSNPTADRQIINVESNNMAPPEAKAHNEWYYWTCGLPGFDGVEGSSLLPVTGPTQLRAMTGVPLIIPYTAQSRVSTPLELHVGTTCDEIRVFYVSDESKGEQIERLSAKLNQYCIYDETEESLGGNQAAPNAEALVGLMAELLHLLQKYAREKQSFKLEGMTSIKIYVNVCRSLQCNEVFSKEDGLYVSMVGTEMTPRFVRLSYRLCSTAFEVSGQLVKNFGEVNVGTKKSTKLSIANQCRSTLFVQLRKSHSATSGHVRLLGSDAQDVLLTVRPYATKEIELGFSAGITGGFEEKVTMTNLLSPHNNYTLTVKASITKADTFEISPDAWNFEPFCLPLPNAAPFCGRARFTALNTSQSTREIHLRLLPSASTKGATIKEKKGKKVKTVPALASDAPLSAGSEASGKDKTGSAAAHAALTENPFSGLIGACLELSLTIDSLGLSSGPTRRIEEQLEHLEQKIKIYQRKNKTEKLRAAQQRRALLQRQLSGEASDGEATDDPTHYGFSESDDEAIQSIPAEASKSSSVQYEAEELLRLLMGEGVRLPPLKAGESASVQLRFRCWYATAAPTLPLQQSLALQFVFFEASDKDVRRVVPVSWTIQRPAATEAVPPSAALPPSQSRVEDPQPPLLTTPPPLPRSAATAATELRQAKAVVAGTGEKKPPPLPSRLVIDVPPTKAFAVYSFQLHPVLVLPYSVPEEAMEFQLTIYAEGPPTRFVMLDSRPLQTPLGETDAKFSFSPKAGELQGTATTSGGDGPKEVDHGLLIHGTCTPHRYGPQGYAITFINTSASPTAASHYFSYLFVMIYALPRALPSGGPSLLLERSPKRVTIEVQPRVIVFPPTATPALPFSGSVVSYDGRQPPLSLGLCAQEIRIRTPGLAKSHYLRVRSNRPAQVLLFEDRQCTMPLRDHLLSRFYAADEVTIYVLLCPSAKSTHTTTRAFRAGLIVELLSVSETIAGGGEPKPPSPFHVLPTMIAPRLSPSSTGAGTGGRERIVQVLSALTVPIRCPAIGSAALLIQDQPPPRLPVPAPTPAVNDRCHTSFVLRNPSSTFTVEVELKTAAGGCLSVDPCAAVSPLVHPAAGDRRVEEAGAAAGAGAITTACGSTAAAALWPIDEPRMHEGQHTTLWALPPQTEVRWGLTLVLPRPGLVEEALCVENKACAQAPLRVPVAALLPDPFLRIEAEAEPALVLPIAAVCWDEDDAAGRSVGPSEGKLSHKTRSRGFHLLQPVSTVLTIQHLPGEAAAFLKVVTEPPELVLSVETGSSGTAAGSTAQRSSTLLSPVASRSSSLFYPTFPVIEVPRDESVKVRWTLQEVPPLRPEEEAALEAHALVKVSGTVKLLRTTSGSSSSSSDASPRDQTCVFVLPLSVSLAVSEGNARQKRIELGVVNEWDMTASAASHAGSPVASSIIDEGESKRQRERRGKTSLSFCIDNLSPYLPLPLAVEGPPVIRFAKDSVVIPPGGSITLEAQLQLALITDHGDFAYTVYFVNQSNPGNDMEVLVEGCHYHRLFELECDPGLRELDDSSRPTLEGESLRLPVLHLDPTLPASPAAPSLLSEVRLVVRTTSPDGVLSVDLKLNERCEGIMSLQLLPYADTTVPINHIAFQTEKAPYSTSHQNNRSNNHPHHSNSNEESELPAPLSSSSAANRSTAKLTLESLSTPKRNDRITARQTSAASSAAGSPGGNHTNTGAASTAASHPPPAQMYRQVFRLRYALVDCTRLDRVYAAFTAREKNMIAELLQGTADAGRSGFSATTTDPLWLGTLHVRHPWAAEEVEVHVSGALEAFATFTCAPTVVLQPRLLSQANESAGGVWKGERGQARVPTALVPLLEAVQQLQEGGEGAAIAMIPLTEGTSGEKMDEDVPTSLQQQTPQRPRTTATTNSGSSRSSRLSKPSDGEKAPLSLLVPSAIYSGQLSLFNTCEGYTATLQLLLILREDATNRWAEPPSQAGSAPTPSAGPAGSEGDAGVSCTHFPLYVEVLASDGSSTVGLLLQRTLFSAVPEGGMGGAVGLPVQAVPPAGSSGSGGSTAASCWSLLRVTVPAQSKMTFKIKLLPLPALLRWWKKKRVAGGGAEGSLSAWLQRSLRFAVMDEHVLCSWVNCSVDIAPLRSIDLVPSHEPDEVSSDEDNGGRPLGTDAASSAAHEEFHAAVSKPSTLSMEMAEKAAAGGVSLHEVPPLESGEAAAGGMNFAQRSKGRQKGSEEYSSTAQPTPHPSAIASPSNASFEVPPTPTADSGSGGLALSPSGAVGGAGGLNSSSGPVLSLRGAQPLPDTPGAFQARFIFAKDKPSSPELTIRNLLSDREVQCKVSTVSQSPQVWCLLTEPPEPIPPGGSCELPVSLSPMDVGSFEAFFLITQSIRPGEVLYLHVKGEVYERMTSHERLYELRIASDQQPSLAHLRLALQHSRCGGTAVAPSGAVGGAGGGGSGASASLPLHSPALGAEGSAGGSSPLPSSGGLEVSLGTIYGCGSRRAHVALEIYNRSAVALEFPIGVVMPFQISVQPVWWESSEGCGAWHRLQRWRHRRRRRGCLLEVLRSVEEEEEEEEKGFWDAGGWDVGTREQTVPPIETSPAESTLPAFEGQLIACHLHAVESSNGEKSIVVDAQSTVRIAVVLQTSALRLPKVTHAHDETAEPGHRQRKDALFARFEKQIRKEPVGYRVEGGATVLVQCKEERDSQVGFQVRFQAAPSTFSIEPETLFMAPLSEALKRCGEEDSMVEVESFCSWDEGKVLFGRIQVHNHRDCEEAFLFHTQSGVLQAAAECGMALEDAFSAGGEKARESSPLHVPARGTGYFFVWMDRERAASALRCDERELPPISERGTIRRLYQPNESIRVTCRYTPSGAGEASEANMRTTTGGMRDAIVMGTAVRFTSTMQRYHSALLHRFHRLTHAKWKHQRHAATAGGAGGTSDNQMGRAQRQFSRRSSSSVTTTRTISPATSGTISRRLTGTFEASDLLPLEVLRGQYSTVAGGGSEGEGNDAVPSCLSIEDAGSSHGSKSSQGARERETQPQRSASFGSTASRRSSNSSAERTSSSVSIRMTGVRSRGGRRQRGLRRNMREPRIDWEAIQRLLADVIFLVDELLYYTISLRNSRHVESCCSFMTSVIANDPTVKEWLHMLPRLWAVCSPFSAWKYRLVLQFVEAVSGLPSYSSATTTGRRARTA